MAARELCPGPRPRRPDGVPLLRHRRRAAAVACLADLRDLGLGEELQVEGDLPDHAGGDREGRAELGDRRAVRVPGERRLCERELASEERGDLDASLAERREGSRRAAELGGEGLPQLGKAPARIGEPRRASRPP